MKELPNVPKEFLEPILPCLNLLENCSVYLYAGAVKKCIWKKYVHLSQNVVSLVTYQIALTMYLGNVFSGDLKLDEIAYVVSVYVVSIQAILKAMVVVLKKSEIKAIILQLGSMWRTEDLTEVQINKKNSLLKRLKFCYAVFYWINMIGSWQYILAPLLETVFRKFILQQECGLLLPFCCSFPFDPTGNWARYIGVYIFETYSNRPNKKKVNTALSLKYMDTSDRARDTCKTVYAMYVVVFRIIYFYLGTEFLMIILCSHLATAFTLLQEDLLNIKPGNLASLKIIIDSHQKLISLTQQLDNVFDKVIFINLTSATISICFFGLSAKVAHGALQIANNFAAVVCLTLPLFNLCYYGEMLREASAGMADSVCNNPWYQGDLRYQKLLWFIIMRSQKPCCLTSMKYNPITLNTFTTVLSTTWSYFSLASSVYEGES